MRKKLEQLLGADTEPAKQLVQELLQSDLPQLERDLQNAKKELELAPADVNEAPSAQDLRSFPALHSWATRVLGVALPESELRQEYESRPDGGVGKHRSLAPVAKTMMEGAQKYTKISGPVLAIFGDPPRVPPSIDNVPALRSLIQAENAARVNPFERGVPSAHVIRLPYANHYIFASNENDVLREIHAFIGSLPQ